MRFCQNWSSSLCKTGNKYNKYSHITPKYIILLPELDKSSIIFRFKYFLKFYDIVYAKHIKNFIFIRTLKLTVRLGTKITISELVVANGYKSVTYTITLYIPIGIGKFSL